MEAGLKGVADKQGVRSASTLLSDKQVYEP